MVDLPTLGRPTIPIVSDTLRLPVREDGEDGADRAACAWSFMADMADARADPPVYGVRRPTPAMYRTLGQALAYGVSQGSFDT
ncbi:hypothetical protein SAV14893_024930 [Streptomyces avermitilis]|uniref:Uncharacterized protein n=1 Tax=Streptomyces avermitilis TaxID=33903 RepID=A0A4D4N0J5_STRAX|nr:hypothetical protein SAVMC3_37010 [Streptomyces avermitilis]GDY63100.1 hypothetical protein SAV14893_024930 [Streptomyces avermitilis]GDY76767.1 hypothetical protein SAV31267_062520 [Streptomyces avermitilis]GDY85693.1 hypothetical protein SAVCW2_48920 [Streptomyces avermitilis]